MVINSLKAIFFIGGGAVVAAGAAYVTGALDIFLPESQTAVASLPSPQAAPSAPAMTAQPAQPEAAAPNAEQPAAQDATPQDAASDVVIPSFDIVRVEPDGSLVIAGRAAPVATVEIVTGDRTIGRGEANDTGEFAIVLDDPLAPGDYTIVLRSTTRDAIVAASTETAIVSIPDNEHGQVLALVEQPGAPSRLITVPEAAAPKQDRPAAAQTPAETGQMAAEPAGDTPEAESPAGIAAAPQVAEKPSTEAKPGEMASAPAEQPKPEQPVASEQQSAQEPAGSEPVDESTTAEAKPAEPESQQMAAAPQAAEEQAAAQPQTPAEQPRIAVEAVEIEGRKVFVAGRAEVGSRVRVYANDILLGDAQTSDGGRFLVEAERDLPVGDYIVRADMLSSSAQVLARAAVPFQREPGEAVAAVAAAPEPQSMVQQPVEATSQSDTSKPAETAATGIAPAEPAVGQPAGQVAAPATSGEKPAGGQQIASAPASESGDVPAPGAAATEPTGEQIASVPTAPSTEAVQQPADAAGQEVTAPKLQNVAGAVIIRRGDTLWRISKRVYGRGVRYTTIYLANQEQIEDPDRIWPGQVFSVPDKTAAGENADMSAIADRLPESQTETR